jgi:AraC family transcriptional regulator, arabinose operon regulatory protein
MHEMAKNMQNPAVADGMEHIQHMSFLVGEGRNSRAAPHWVEWLRWLARAPGIRAVHVADRPQRQRVEACLAHAIEVRQGPLPRREAFAMNSLEEALLRCDMANPANATAQLSAPVRAALAYLCEHLGDSVTLPRLARIAGLSRSRLAHAFREQVGVSPMRYLETRRIAQARELLLMAVLSVAEVAARVGYANAFYFSRVFSRQTGISPSAFRKQGR